MKRAYLSVLTFLSSMALSAQTGCSATDSVRPIDTLFLSQVEAMMDSLERRKQIESVVSAYEGQMLRNEMKLRSESSFQLLGGLFQTYYNHDFNNRKVLFAGNRHDMGDYVPAVLPLAATYALKAAGVESRSKTKRMLTANALTYALALGLTEGLKRSVGEWRPNGEDDYSFPSGHSSFAFASAVILHREYGHLSPWVSVGGYAAATSTQLLRIRHNAHYVNDVAMGAGIGIASANLAYFLTDLYYKADGLNPPRLTKGDVVRLGRYLERPTSVSVFTGMELGTKTLDDACFEKSGGVADGVVLKTSSTFSTGVEYSCFLNANWAAELLFRMTTTKVKPLYTSQSGFMPEVYGNDLNHYHLNAALKYSRPVGLAGRLSARVLAGERLSASTDFIGVDDGRTYLSIPRSLRFEYGAGVSFDMFGDSKYTTGFSVDYLHAASPLMSNRWNICTYWRILL